MTTEPQGDAQRDAERGATRDIGSLMTRNLIGQGLSVARQLVILPLITPAELGLFRFVQQLVAYSHIFQFGALSIFKVRYPEWLAAGRKRDCDVLQTMAWRQVLVGAALFAPLLAAALLSQTALPWPVIFIVSLVGVAPLFADYSVASFNVRGRFAEIARLDIFVAAVSFVALLLGALLFGLYGLVLASLVGSLLRCAVASEHFWPRPIARPDPGEFRAHFGFGARLWVGSAVSTFASTCDVVVLGVLLGSSPALGTYALAVTICQLLSQDVRAVTLVHQRRLQMQIGRIGTAVDPDVRAAMRGYAALDCYLGVMVACASVAATASVLPWAVPAHAEAAFLVGPIACALVILRAKRYSTTILNQAGRIAVVVGCGALQLGLLVGGFVVLSASPSAPIGAYALVAVGAAASASILEVVLAHAVMGALREGITFAVRLAFALAPLWAGLGVAPLFVDSPLGLIALAGAALAAATLCAHFALEGVPRRAAELLGEVLRAKIRAIRRRR